MAFTDAQLMFSVSQAIDGVAVEPSENAIDLGLNNGVAGTGRDIGVGDPLEIFVRAHNRGTIDLTLGGTVNIGLWTHTAATPATIVSAGRRLWTSPGGIALTAASGADYMVVIFRVPFGRMDQFLALSYDKTDDDGPNWEVTAGIVHTMTQYRQYESGLKFAT